MEVKVILEGKKHRIKIRKNMSIKQLAKQLNLTLQNYIVKKDNEIVPDTEVIKDKSKIEFLRIVSGG
jgi:sulfur carrier protein ThiS